MTAMEQDKPTMFALSDAWFIISEFMTYQDITAVSITNKEANELMNQSPVWEQQCQRFFDTNINNQNKSEDRFKQHFRNFIEIYGHNSVEYYKRVTYCWNKFIQYIQTNLPKMLATFNPPATPKEINDFKKHLCPVSMLSNNNFSYLTPYLIMLGECCNGQNRLSKHGSRQGIYGYYSFYNKSSSGHLLSICESIKYTQQVCDTYSNKELSNNNIWLYYAGIPTRDRLITIPCLTFIHKITGNVCKITQDSKLITLKHGNTNSFIDHFEEYVLNNLLQNNYRINKEYGILRFPLNDIAVSECITKGIICRASPLFVSEISNIEHNNYIFPYHIEIECPTTYHDLNNDLKMKKRCKECNITESNPYQLTTRTWYIKDDDANKDPEIVHGPGVIGLYPKVFVNQEIFQYESCSQQNTPKNGEMWGSFAFEQNCDNNDGTRGKPFDLQLKPYKLDWDICQWI
eukprot:501720_1